MEGTSITGGRSTGSLDQDLPVKGSRFSLIRADLFIRRRDNGRWGMPAGGIELRETVFEALRREVKEETGLEVVDATLVAVYSGEAMTFKSAYGNEYRGLVFAFRIDEWRGDLVRETDETTDAQFLDESEYPEAYEQYREFLDDLNSFAGTVVLK